MFGQIIATSHIFSPQKVAEVSGNPLISGKSKLPSHQSWNFLAWWKGKSRLANYYDLARSCWVSASSFLWKPRWRTSSSSASPEGKATTSSWCCFGRCPMFFLRGFKTSSFTTMGDQFWRCAPIGALPEDSSKRMHKSFVTWQGLGHRRLNIIQHVFFFNGQCMVYLPTLTIKIN